MTREVLRGEGNSEKGVLISPSAAKVYGMRLDELARERLERVQQKLDVVAGFLPREIITYMQEGFTTTVETISKLQTSKRVRVDETNHQEPLQFSTETDNTPLPAGSRVQIFGDELRLLRLGVAHTINTALSSVQGLAELMKNDSTYRHIHTHLAAIDQTTRDISTDFSEVFNASRIVASTKQQGLRRFETM